MTGPLVRHPALGPAAGATPPGPRSRSVTGRFVADQVQTASPGSLLVMLYDRLVLDLARAEEAQRGEDRAAAHEALLHAQEVVGELLATLDVEAWSGGEGLSALYAFLIAELVRANTSRDPDRTAACRELVEPLRDAWREALGAARPEAAAAPAQVAG